MGSGILVHFSFGMAIGFLFLIILVFKKSRSWIYFPFLITAFGIFAAIPNIINNLTGIPIEKHFISNIFFLNPIIDKYLLKGFGASGLIILIYNLIAIVYLVYIYKEKK